MKRILEIAAALLIGTWLPLSASAADFAKNLRGASELLAARKYDEAYKAYLHAAEDQNNPLAQFTLGLFHELGWGRPVDMAEACAWQEKSAKGGIPAAEDRYATCLLNGVGRPADPAEAARWFQRAGDDGHLISYCRLARLYVEGRGVPKDPAKGLALCEQVAAKGSPPAMVEVARFHLEGVTGKPDYETASQLLQQAAKLNSPEAPFLLGKMAHDGLGAPAKPDAARFWFETAASRGYVPAYYQTARLYFDQRGGPKAGGYVPDYVAKAYMWLSATVARTTDKDERASSAEMLAEIRKIMPPTWAPDLDKKVKDHLAKFSGE